MKSLVFSLFLLSHSLNCSSQILSSTDSLRFWGDAMISLKTPDFRQAASSEFQKIAEKLIRENSDSILLDFHPSIVKTSTHDGKLKFYSWASELSENRIQYFSYLFFDHQKPVFLKSQERNLRRINYEELNAKNWYGALYYHILKDSFSARYFLLGFATSPDGTKHRIIEPLYIDKDQILFGAPLFVKKDENQKDEVYHRILIHYSPSAQAVVNYNPELKQIMYDHISSYTDAKSGETLLVPDGTFEAFDWNGSHWIHNPYLKNEILESAPIDKPLFNADTKSRDILGRKKSK
ncbi:MAG: hypothetical protein IPM92_06430 [Saprospiraceae bacterium]|nr:hypothetical protein [Saprospiraceae bacterium]